MAIGWTRANLRRSARKRHRSNKWAKQRVRPCHRKRFGICIGCRRGAELVETGKGGASRDSGNRARARQKRLLPHECGVPTCNGAPHSCGKSCSRKNLSSTGELCSLEVAHDI